MSCMMQALFSISAPKKLIRNDITLQNGPDVLRTLFVLSKSVPEFCSRTGAIFFILSIPITAAIWFTTRYRPTSRDRN